MDDSSIASTAGTALPERPGPLGRLLRLALGLGTVWLLYPLVSVWRPAFWSGDLPVRELGFWVLALLALGCTGTVFDLGLRLSAGRRTRNALLAGAVLAAAVGLAASGEVPNRVLGVYLWGWFVALLVLMGPAHLLAAALGTPGCEMRSYAHARALLRGGDVATVVCPGGIDRLDHVGRRSRRDFA